MNETTLMDLQLWCESFKKRMGWWKVATNLEALMLVVSECGEAANEVRGDEPTDHFGEELADIVLRVFGIAAENGIDLESAIVTKCIKNDSMEPGHKGRLK